MARAKNFLTGAAAAAAAAADLERQKEAHDKRRKGVGCDLPFTPERNPKEHPWPEDYLEALCCPVRIQLTFDDLPKTAKQIRILKAAANYARAVLYDVHRSQQQKRLDLRVIMKRAADEMRELDRAKTVRQS